MQNAIWKLSALAGVVGIGFLVMLQVQQGMSLHPSSGGEQQAATEDPLGTGEKSEVPANAPPGQTEPNFDGEQHADHKHDSDGHEEGLSHHASGIDFRTEGSGKAAESSGSAVHPKDDDPFGATTASSSKKPQTGNKGSQTTATEDDPFAEFNSPPKKKTLSDNRSLADNQRNENGIKPTSHEEEVENKKSESATPAAEIDDSKNPAGGPGPQLLPVPDGEPARVKEAEANKKSTAADEFDPFPSAENRSKEDQPKASAAKPRVLPSETEPSTADASARPTGAADEKDEFKNDSRDADKQHDNRPAKDEPTQAPKKLASNPSPDPAAFDPVEEKGKAAKVENEFGSEPKSQLGSKSSSSSDRGPALPETSSPFAVQEEKQEEQAASGSGTTDTTSQPGPNLGGAKPDKLDKNSGPRIAPHEGGLERNSLQADGTPNRLNTPDNAAQIGEGANSEFQGDGTITGDVQLGPQRPQLTIEKVAPPNAVLGQPLIYSILVKNAGTTPANNVVVEDRIPRGSKLSGTIPRAELSEKTLIWKLGNLAPGEQRKISVRVVPLEPGQIGSVATVNFVAEVAAETNITAPQLRIDLAGPREAKLGELVPFHFRVTNTGTGEASGVVIRDLLPEGLKHSAGNDLEYEVGKLPPGEWREIKLALTAAKVGAAVNKAVATADGGVKSEAKVSVEIYGTKLAVKRTGPTRRYIERTAIYTNTVTNDSQRPIETVTVSEVVPEGFEFAEASDGGQYHPGSRTVAWQVSRLGPGESREVKVKLVPKSPGTLTSVVKAMAAGGEPAETTLQTVVEGFSALRLEIPNIETPVDVGEKTNLRIVARNQGNSPAKNVELLVEIPSQFKVVTARGPSKYEQTGNQLRFTAIPSVDGRTAAAFDIELEAIEKGDARLRVQVGGDHLDRPLVREESILVLSDGQ